MLYVTQKIEDVRYADLMNVYEESNRSSGEKLYARFSSAEQLLLAEQDLYSYLQFALEDGGWFVAWAPSGIYQSALRLERYSDGFLITALETAPAARNRGYADALIKATIAFFASDKIYAHIYNDNEISINLHMKNGFVCIKNSAELLDSTISTDAHTYLLVR